MGVSTSNYHRPTSKYIKINFSMWVSSLWVWIKLSEKILMFLKVD